MLLGLLDFILNLAGLLMWLNWRAAGFDPLARATPATLAGTLRRAGKTPLKRWQLPAMIAGLVLVRAFFYLEIGSAAGWTASLDLGAISVLFRSDRFGRILLFSVLSFALTLATFYLWLLLLSLLRPDTAEAEPMSRVVRQHLGRMDRWPAGMKALAPFLAGTCIWWLLSWPLVGWGIVPKPLTGTHRVEEAVVIGLCAYLPWKYLIASLLVAHLAGSYVYFGNHPFWSYVNAVSRILLTPLRPIPLRVGRVDFSPVLALVILFLANIWLKSKWGLPGLYAHLPI